MKILITGASGLLGRHVTGVLHRDYTSVSVDTPTHREMDVTQVDDVFFWADRIQPDVVLHLAAFTGVAAAERPRNHWEAYRTNVLGSANVAMLPCRIVYISSDYVFDGAKGLYHEDDPARPVNFYGWTKLLGEYEIKAVSPDYLIIRTSFCRPDRWPYPRAFVDQWTSREPVTIIAPQIVRAALSDLRGTVHIGGPRKTVFELAKSIDPGVRPGYLRDVTGVTLPRDTSLNTIRWQEFQSNSV